MEEYVSMQSALVELQNTIEEMQKDLEASSQGWDIPGFQFELVFLGVIASIVILCSRSMRCARAYARMS